MNRDITAHPTGTPGMSREFSLPPSWNGYYYNSLYFNNLKKEEKISKMGISVHFFMENLEKVKYPPNFIKIHKKNWINIYGDEVWNLFILFYPTYFIRFFLQKIKVSFKIVILFTILEL